VFTAVRKSGFTTLAIVDGDLRGAEADVFLDQNLGSELDEPVLPAGATRLAGLDYVLLRDEILSLRPAEPPVPGPGGVPKVFAFFGGTMPSEPARTSWRRSQRLVRRSRRPWSLLVMTWPRRLPRSSSRKANTSR